eukprot:g11678.t1
MAVSTSATKSKVSSRGGSSISPSSGLGRGHRSRQPGKISGVALARGNSKQLALLQTSASASASSASRTSSTAGFGGIMGEHTVGSWRAKEDYLIKFSYIPPGASAAQAQLNSCADANLSQTLGRERGPNY